MKRIELKLRKKTCVFCHERRARYQYRGRVRWDRFHSLCFSCYDSFSDRLRAALTAPTAAVTEEAESSLGVSPVPLITELERSTYPASSPLPPYAGDIEFAVTVGAAQHGAALTGGNL